MADTEIMISELPVADTVSPTDQLEANQSGTTRSITLQQIAGFAGGIVIDVAWFGAVPSDPSHAVANAIIIQNALLAARDTGRHLSGKGLTYYVSGNIVVPDGFWLQDIKLIQTDPAGAPFDNSGFSLRRTLYSGDDNRLEVGGTLIRVVVDRNGTPDDNTKIGLSGGIFLAGHPDITANYYFEDVEVRGGGRGTLVLLTYVNQLVVDGLEIHDAYWHTTDDPGSGGEQIVGFLSIIANSIRMDRLKIHHLMGWHDNGTNANWLRCYQTDGMGISETRGGTINEPHFSWCGEAIDMSGNHSSSNVWFVDGSWEDCLVGFKTSALRNGGLKGGQMLRMGGIATTVYSQSVSLPYVSVKDISFSDVSVTDTGASHEGDALAPTVGHWASTINANFTLEFIVNVDSDTLIVPKAEVGQLVTGRVVRVSTNGTLPVPLLVNTDYYLISGFTYGSCRLATTLANANLGIAVDLTSAGSGQMSLAPFSFTADPVTDTLFVPLASLDPPLRQGAIVTISTSGTPPAPLAINTEYWIISDILVDATHCKLATSLANATAGTAIDITSAGSGNHFINSQITNFAPLLENITYDNCEVFANTATANGWIADTTLEVPYASRGAVVKGQNIAGAGVTAGTFIRGRGKLAAIVGYIVPDSSGGGTLTVLGTTWGAVTVNQQVTGPNVMGHTEIVAAIDATHWTVNNLQSVGSSSSPRAFLLNYLPEEIALAKGYIAGTTLTLTEMINDTVPVRVGMGVYARGKILNNTRIVSGSGMVWQVNVSQSAGTSANPLADIEILTQVFTVSPSQTVGSTTAPIAMAMTSNLDYGWLTQGNISDDLTLNDCTVIGQNLQPFHNYTKRISGWLDDTDAYMILAGSDGRGGLQILTDLEGLAPAKRETLFNGTSVDIRMDANFSAKVGNFSNYDVRNAGDGLALAFNLGSYNGATGDFSYAGGVEVVATDSWNSQPQTLNSLSWSAGIATAVSSVAHGIAVGDTFTLLGSTPGGWDGQFVATAGTTGTTLKWALALNPGTATVVGSILNPRVPQPAVFPNIAKHSSALRGRAITQGNTEIVFEADATSFRTFNAFDVHRDDPTLRQQVVMRNYGITGADQGVSLASYLGSGGINVAFGGAIDIMSLGVWDATAGSHSTKMRARISRGGGQATVWEASGFEFNFASDITPKATAPGAGATGTEVVNAAWVLGKGYTSSTGTVTTVSVVSTNGLAGSVANPTTAPAITLSTTITGLLKGNGTAISAAVAGTDYMTPGNVSSLYLPLAGGTITNTLTVTNTQQVGTSATANATINSTAGAFTSADWRRDFANLTTLENFRNYGITAATHGVAIDWSFGTGGVLGATAGRVIMRATGDWSGAGAPRAAEFVVQTATAGVLGSSILANDTSMTIQTFLRFGGSTSGQPMLKRNGAQLQVRLADDSANGTLVADVFNAGTEFQRGGTKVVGARDTGWAAMTGTTNKATVYDTASVTLPQLAGRVMALQAMLTTHGLNGP